MIVVTGATGTVGSEVVRQLVAAGERPRALVRDPDKARARFGQYVEHVTGDLDRPETLAPGLAGADRVFLLTRQSSRQPQQERAVVDAAARAGVRHLVKLSVFRADERSPLQIARQHGEMERAATQSGLVYTFIRPVFFMQNLLGMVREGAIHTAAEDGRVAMVDARDVAAVAVDALTSRGCEGQTYTLTGPQALCFDEVAEILSKQTGKRIRHVRIPPNAVRTAMKRNGVEAWFAQDMAQLHTMLAAGYEALVTDEVAAVTGTSSRTLTEFGQDFASQFTGPHTGR